MKKIFGVLVVLLLSSFVLTAKASAREGSISLSSSDVACEGVSVWRDGSYRVTGRCDGLVYPYETQYDRYTLWAKLTNGEVTRVDNVERGYFDGNVFNTYSSLFITAETSTSPRRPSDKQVASGSVTAFSFDKSENVEPTPVPTPAATTTTGGITVQNSTAATTSNVGTVIGTILKSLLVIVAVIVVITIVASLLFRRRGSVSA